MARTSSAFGLAGCVMLLLAPGVARAQYPMAPAGTAPGALGGGVAGAGTTGMMAPNANPYTNPYLNPFMNPYAATMMNPNGVSPTQTALYFFAAQQANGGIGSGRLSGTRPDPSASRGAVRTAPNVAPATAAQPVRGGPNTPGATASRYFNRGFQANAGASRMYNRQNGHFPVNRR